MEIVPVLVLFAREEDGRVVSEALAIKHDVDDRIVVGIREASPLLGQLLQR